MDKTSKRVPVLKCPSTGSLSTTADCPEQMNYANAKEDYLASCAGEYSGLSSSSMQGSTDVYDGIYPSNYSPEDEKDLLMETEILTSGASCGHKCSQCGKELPNDVALTLHILCAHVPVECEICGVHLSSLSQAAYHKDLAHKESKYNCPKCSKKFLQKNPFEAHVVICAKKSVSCSVCSAQFKSLFSLRDHQKRRCPGTISPHKAMPDEHDTDTIDFATTRQQLLQAQFGSDFSITDCSYCDKKLSDVKKLHSHMRTYHQEYKCEVCGMASPGLIKHRAHKFACHKRNSFRCLTCGMEFRYKGRYQEHLSTCELKKLSCEICGQLFRMPSCLTRHKRKKHSNEAILANAQIDEEQPEPHSTETEIPVEEYDDQGQSTVNSSIMTQNSDDCKIADTSGQTILQDAHAESRITDNESQTFPDDTLRGIKTKVAKISHWCSICGLGYPNFNKFNHHKWTVHMPHKYQCSTCTRTFPFKSALENHAFTCATKKHGCELCNRKFKTLASVKRHRKRCYNMEEKSRPANVEAVKCIVKPSSIGEEESDKSLTDCNGTMDVAHDHSELHADNCDDAEVIPSLHTEDSSLTSSMAIQDVRKDATVTPVSQGEKFELKSDKMVEHTTPQEQLKMVYIPSSDGKQPNHADEVYQENKTKLLREIDLVRLVFRCTVCSWDYMSLDDLWNHLNQHKIADDSKNQHYQEIKSKDKLYECDLCNDHRAYSEGLYWIHVLNVHDGFFLRCSECGETFRSEQLKKDHSFGHCKARKQLSHVDKSFIFSVKSEPSFYDPVPDINSAMNVNVNAAKDTKNTGADGLSIAETAEESGPFTCDVCGLTFTSNHAAYYHKKTKHGQMHKCPHCRRIFLMEDYHAHLSVCEQNRISCKLCDTTFQMRRNLTRHMKRIHNVKRKVKKQPEKEQVVAVYDCDICVKTFPSYSHLHYHKRKDHGRNNKCPHCRCLFDVEGYEDHVESCAKRTRVSCEICHSKYQNSVYLARHMKRMHRPKITSNSEDQIEGEQNTVAEIITPTSSTDMDSVKAVNDTTKKSSQQLVGTSSSCSSKSKCPHCNKEYVKGRPFLNHMRSTHRPSECTICGITIYGTEKARYHKIQKHTDPTFHCDKCSKKFHFKKEFHFHRSICDPTTKTPRYEKPRARSQLEQVDLRMEIKVEEPTLETQDDYGNAPTDTLTDLHGGKPMNEAFDHDEIKKECPDEEDSNYA